MTTILQGSPEWHRARLGIPTASRFHRIMTPQRREYASGARTLMHELLAERWLQAPVGSGSAGEWAARGLAEEDPARAWYSLVRDVEVERAGFLCPPHGRWGGSPDGLVGDEGMVEVKTLSPSRHVGVLLGDGVPEEMLPQIQGLLWISERQWCDLVAWHPVMPPAVVRIPRDPAYIELLAAMVERFCGELDEAWERLRGMSAGGGVERELTLPL